MYLGVTDAGIVEGFLMSQFQREHFLLALRDLLAAFQPAVPEKFISARFVPVVDQDETNVSHEFDSGQHSDVLRRMRAVKVSTHLDYVLT